MNIARPPGGFKLVLAPVVRAHADAVMAEDPEFRWRWESVLLRLAYTAHREGVAVTGNPSERAGAFDFPGIRIKLAWRVLGDTVTILKGDF